MNLPSGDAAIDWLAGKPGGGARVLTSMALRSALVASGLAAIGFRGKDLAKATAAAVLAIEVGVLAWASRGPAPPAALGDLSLQGRALGRALQVRRG